MGWVLGVLGALVVINAVLLARWYWHSLRAAWREGLPDPEHVEPEPSGLRIR